MDVMEACPCCRTAVATGADGAVYIAWRRVFPGDVRDIVVARSTDYGRTWSAPVRAHEDGWVFAGCPHAGPAMQMDSRGRLHVVWWTGKEGSAGVYYARSDDGARTFRAPVALGTAEFSRPAHVQLALANDSTVVAVWDDGTRDVPRVVMRVSRDGGERFGSVEEVSAAGRAATFPVLAVRGRQLHIAWSEVTEVTHRHEEQVKAEQATRNPEAPMGLHAIGESQIVVRTGTIE